MLKVTRYPLFIYALLAAYASGLSAAIMFYVLEPAPFLDLLPDFVFVVVLALLVFFFPFFPEVSLGRAIRQGLAFLALSISVGIIGAILAQYNLILGLIVGAPMLGVGLYPSGPDVWLPIGATYWLVSTMGFLTGGILIGLLMRKMWKQR